MGIVVWVWAVARITVKLPPRLMGGNLPGAQRLFLIGAGKAFVCRYANAGRNFCQTVLAAFTGS